MGKIIWLSIPVCVIAAFILGALWYGPLFRKAWMEDTRITEESRRHQGKIFAGAALFALIGAFAVNLLLDRTIGLLAHTSGGILIGFAAASAIGINYMFAMKPRRLLYIDGGYSLVLFGAMGLIVGLMK